MNGPFKIRHTAVKLICGIGIAWGLYGCEAPHSNPFDPESPGYRPPSAPTAVSDLALDSLLPVKALLSWTVPEGASSYLLYHGPAGWDGKSLDFATLYTGVMPEVGTVHERQSLWIDVRPLETRSWALFSRSHEGVLSPPSDTLTISPPRRDRSGSVTAKVTSLYVALWTPPDFVELGITATVSDSDGVDSVWAVCPFGNLDSLSRTSNEDVWSAQIPEYDLPEQNIEKLVGYPIWVYYRDGAGVVTRSEPTYLIRVIYYIPILNYPVFDTVRVPNPRMEWEPLDLGFRYSYNLDIIHVDSNYIPRPWYHAEGISSDSSHHDLTKNLTADPRYYAWTLSVIDEFGNQAISLEPYFYYKNGE